MAATKTENSDDCIPRQARTSDVCGGASSLFVTPRLRATGEAEPELKRLDFRRPSVGAKIF
jgi:hypothetical protein